MSEVVKGEEEVRMVLANRFGLGMMLWDGIGGVDRSFGHDDPASCIVLPFVQWDVSLLDNVLIALSSPSLP